MLCKSEKRHFSQENGNKCHLIIDQDKEEPLSHESDFSIEEQQKKKTEKKVLQTKCKEVNSAEKTLSEWTHEEDELLFEKYSELGSKWVELSVFFPHKSDNSIKNRFYCCMRKVQRKMNKIQREKKLKHRKPIRYDSLLTILEIGKYDPHANDKRFENIKDNMEGLMELRELIIGAAMQSDHRSSETKMETLIHKFVELKFSLKFINIERVKKCVKVGFQEEEINELVLHHKSEDTSGHDKLNSDFIEETQQHHELNDSMLSQINFEISREKEHSNEHDKEHGLISECGEMMMLDSEPEKFDLWFFM